MTIAAESKGHLNSIARNIGIRPDCRDTATDEELACAREWMRLRAAAYREQVEHNRRAALKSGTDTDPQRPTEDR